MAKKDKTSADAEAPQTGAVVATDTVDESTGSLHVELADKDREILELKASLRETKEELAEALARAAKLAKATPVVQPARAERFRGSLKDAAEQQHKLRLSEWDCLTVVYEEKA